MRVNRVLRARNLYRMSLLRDLNKIISLVNDLPEIPENKQYTVTREQLLELIGNTVKREPQSITERKRKAPQLIKANSESEMIMMSD